MSKFHKPLRIGVALTVLALPVTLAGCAAYPHTQANQARAANSNIPPYGPTRTVIAPDGSTYNCRIAGGQICPQP